VASDQDESMGSEKFRSSGRSARAGSPAQLGRIGVRAGFQIQRAATEIDVLGQNPNAERA
jgi:hypothetical protein